MTGKREPPYISLLGAANMKKLMALMLLFHCTVFAQISSVKFIGTWSLVSNTEYLVITFNQNGTAAITMGLINGPLTSPLGTWSVDNDELVIKGQKSVIYKYSNIKFTGSGFTAINSRGVAVEFFNKAPNTTL